MKISLAYYINSKTFFSKLIRFQQRYLQLSHYWETSHTEAVYHYSECEAVLNLLNEYVIYDKDNNKIEAFYQKKKLFKKYNLWISSDEWDWWTRAKFIERNSKHWILQGFEVSEEKYVEALKFWLEKTNKSYWILPVIFGQWLNSMAFASEDNLFCSQFVTMQMQVAWIFPVTLISLGINPAEICEYWIEQKITTNKYLQPLFIFSIFLILYLIF